MFARVTWYSASSSQVSRTPSSSVSAPAWSPDPPSAVARFSFAQWSFGSMFDSMRSAPIAVLKSDRPNASWALAQLSFFAMNTSSDRASAAFWVRQLALCIAGDVVVNLCTHARIWSIVIPLSARPSNSPLGTGIFGGTPCLRASFSSRLMSTQSPASSDMGRKYQIRGLP